MHSEFSKNYAAILLITLDTCDGILRYPEETLFRRMSALTTGLPSGLKATRAAGDSDPLEKICKVLQRQLCSSLDVFHFS